MRCLLPPRHPIGPTLGNPNIECQVTLTTSPGGPRSSGPTATRSASSPSTWICTWTWGSRHDAGDPLADPRRGDLDAFVESAVNQVVSKRMVKKQQMRWTPEAFTSCPGPHSRAQRRARRGLPPLVPGVRCRAQRGGAGGLIPDTSSHARIVPSPSKRAVSISARTGGVRRSDARRRSRRLHPEQSGGLPTFAGLSAGP
jgi:hypothetical protein